MLAMGTAYDPRGSVYGGRCPPPTAPPEVFWARGRAHAPLVWKGNAVIGAWRLWIAAWGAALAALAGLMWWAARSDFVFRGCPDIPRDEWELTANCGDGWFGMVLFGSLAVICAAWAAVLVWRWFA